MDIEIVPYAAEYQSAFERLNRAWIEKYFEIESVDAEMLANPEKYIIDEGGFVYFAKIDNQVVGTFALVKMEGGVYALSKMAVDEAFRGKNAGNRMLAFCLKKAEELRAEKVILYSNTSLQPAIHLYKKYGFEEVPLTEKDFERANIKMEYIVPAQN